MSAVTAIAMLITSLTTSPSHMPMPPRCLGSQGTGSGVSAQTITRDTERQVTALRASYLITTADDFIVEAYLNGRAIPVTKRSLLQEIFGATVEKIDVEVRRGDWLVFNVVNNRLRWGGTYYFAVAGCFAANEFGFVSQKNSSAWSVCDSPQDADRFISHKNYLLHRPAQPVLLPWDQGDTLMQQYAGSRWSGAPLWGNSRNTWIKYVVE